MATEVYFHPLAAADLESLYDHIALDSPGNAIGYVRRLREQCERLAQFPERGRERPDLRAGVRTFAFERTALIAYTVEAERLVILRVLYGGRDLMAAFPPST